MERDQTAHFKLEMDFRHDNVEELTQELLLTATQIRSLFPDRTVTHSVKFEIRDEGPDGLGKVGSWEVN